MLPTPTPHQVLVTLLCRCPLPEASEVVCDSNCIISPWKAQLNPELMMMAEGGDPVPAGTTCREGRGRAGGRKRKDVETVAVAGCWEPPYTIAASRNSALLAHSICMLRSHK